ncbi:glycosyltransferase family 4 protein [Kallotenue papyrolyticum]|uniref:glycosyltransferase family 4 protein n=1 Tax=Kallotenue papyrolyticum TaxID=1325125 RepID=UPI0004785941|nr:glycosyltransferase family 4 protein [Kallotenue papyrolyticum]
MKVLLLTQVVPYPPDSGPKIKTYHVLRWLAREHDVTLVSFVRTPAEALAAESLRSLCRHIYTVPLHRSRLRDAGAFAHSLHDSRPLILLRDENAELRRLLQRLTHTQAFDLIHVDQLNMAQFALDLDGPPVVLDLHNAVWTIFDRMARSARGARRWLLLRERARLRRYEGMACRKAAAVVAVSEADRAALQQVAGNVRIDVVPIAIDVREQRLIERDPDARAALSVATMFWPPNVDGVCWFGREIYPRIQQRQPDTTFLVVGARPAQPVLDLAARQPGIVVTGYVADLAPYQRQAAAFVVPLRSGSGMRVKILEAFTHGLPVVSTTIGYEGIDARPDEHLLAADDPAGFADAVLRLIHDQRLSRRLVEAGRALAEQLYDWRAVCPALATTYTRALA